MVSENVLLGGQLELSASKVDLGPSQPTTDGSNVLLLPRLEYVFDGDEARFYLAALAGYRYTSTKSTLPNNAGSTEVTGSAGVFGVGLGLHGFISDSCSFEPAISVLRSTGSQTITSSMSQAGFATSNQSLDFSSNGTTVMVSLGIAAWFGEPPVSAVTASPVAAEAAPSSNDDPDDATASARRVDPGPSNVGTASNEQRVELFGGRALELSSAGAPNAHSVRVRVVGAAGDSKLADCRELTVMNGAQASVAPLARESSESGMPTLSGSLSLSLVTALGQTSNLDVCGEPWVVTENGRAQVRHFLEARDELLRKPAVTAPPPAAPATTSPAPDAPSPPPSPPPAVESPPNNGTRAGAARGLLNAEGCSGLRLLRPEIVIFLGTLGTDPGSAIRAAALPTQP